MREHLEKPNELKPCPMCANPKPHLFAFDSGDDYGVECERCPVQIVLQDTREAAVAVWNRRDAEDIES